MISASRGHSRTDRVRATSVATIAKNTSSNVNGRFKYSVAGLSVWTSREIPELRRTEYTDGELTLVFTKRERLPLPVDEQWFQVQLPMGARSYIRSDGELAFVRGIETIGDHAAAVRGAVPLASALQGKVVLHASAVRCPHGVVAFIGESGVGKSTLAAHLSALGFPRLAEDLLPCRTLGDQVIIPVTEAGLAQSAESLSRVFFLSRRTGLQQPRLVPLSSKTHLQRLIRDGFGEIQASTAWATQFRLYHRIVEQVPGYKLHLPDSLNMLEQSLSELQKFLQ